MDQRVQLVRVPSGAADRTEFVNKAIREGAQDLILILPEGAEAENEAAVSALIDACLEGSVAAAFGEILPAPGTGFSAAFLASSERFGLSGDFGREDLYTAGSSLLVFSKRPVMIRREALQKLGLFEADCIFDALSHWCAKALYRGYRIRETAAAVFASSKKPEGGFSLFKYYFTVGRMMKSGIQEFGFSIPLPGVQAEGRPNPAPFPGAADGIARRLNETASLMKASGKRANPLLMKLRLKKAVLAEKLGEKYLYLPEGFVKKNTL